MECGACEPGAKALAKARQQAAGKADFLLVGLNPGDSRNAIDYFRQTTGDPAMPVTSSGALDLPTRWNVAQLSTAIVIAKTGALTFKAVDPSAQDLLTAIDKAAR